MAVQGKEEGTRRSGKNKNNYNKTQTNKRSNKQKRDKNKDCSVEECTNSYVIMQWARKQYHHTENADMQIATLFHWPALNSFPFDHGWNPPQITFTSNRTYWYISPYFTKNGCGSLSNEYGTKCRPILTVLQYSIFSVLLPDRREAIGQINQQNFLPNPMQTTYVLFQNNVISLAIQV